MNQFLYETQDGIQVDSIQIREAIDQWIARKAPSQIKDLSLDQLEKAKSRIFDMVATLGSQQSREPMVFLESFDEDDTITVLRDIGVNTYNTETLPKHVVIHVSGGVASLVYNNSDAKVFIQDFDGYEGERTLGTIGKLQACPVSKIQRIQAWKNNYANGKLIIK